jgi:hypothetical protein
VGKAIILTLLLNRLIEFKSGLASALFTPGMEGLLVMVLWTLIGIGIDRKRRAETLDTGLRYAFFSNGM